MKISQKEGENALLQLPIYLNFQLVSKKNDSKAKKNLRNCPSSNARCHVCDGHWILRIWKLPRLARMLVDDAEHGLPVLRAVRWGVVQDVGEGGEKGIWLLPKNILKNILLFSVWLWLIIDSPFGGKKSAKQYLILSLSFISKQNLTQKRTSSKMFTSGIHAV